MDLPVNPMDILKQGKKFLEEKSRNVVAALFIDPSASDELIEMARTTLVPQTSTARVATEVIGDKVSLRNQRIAEMSFCVFIVGSEPSSARQEEIAARVDVALDANRPVAIVAMGGSKVDLAKRYGVSILNVVLIAHPQEFPEALAEWAAGEVKDERLALAANFTFMRTAVATEFVKATSLQNGIVGGLLFVPGADMPVMTLNQIKMIFQIAAVFDQPLDKDRIKEIAAVIGSAFLFRTVARQLAGMVPIIGWGIKATVAYGGTYAVGIAALNYFEEGGSIDSLGGHLKNSSAEIIERSKEYASVARERLPKRGPRKSKDPKDAQLSKDADHSYIKSGTNDK